MRWAALICLVALLSGCIATGAAPYSPSTPSGTDATPARPAPHPAASGGGANAAPAVTGSRPDFAKEEFWRWLAYETEPQNDPTRDLRDGAWAWGVAVCAQAAAGASPDRLLDLLRANGWSNTGAEAIIKGALNALCPQWNKPPYLTAFDRGVRGAVHVLQQELPWRGPGPDEFDVGWFAKTACGYLHQRNSIDGFEAHLHSHRAGGANQTLSAARIVQEFGSDDVGLRKATGLVVRQTCFDVHGILRYHWNIP